MNLTLTLNVESSVQSREAAKIHHRQSGTQEQVQICNNGVHLSCGWVANWFWIIWTICSILAWWGVWLECRMGRRQGWVQTEDECSVEQLHAFVRYLSGVCWCCCCTIPTIPAFDPHSPRPPPTRGHPSNASGGVGHFMPHFSSCSTIWCHYLGFIILSVNINTKKSA